MIGNNGKCKLNLLTYPVLNLLVAIDFDIIILDFYIS